jgi:hypothetical protein
MAFVIFCVAVFLILVAVTMPPETARRRRRHDNLGPDLDAFLDELRALLPGEHG